MKILSVHQQNYKRIAAIDMEVDKSGNLITVTGQNEQGKSSLIDGIEATIHGASVIPPKPVRKGQEKAALEVVLGTAADKVELIVKRSISANGNTSLSVTNKEGVKQQSPQAILDALYANLSFDPLAFAKMQPKDRSETIRQLLKLDFTLLEKKREEYFGARTDINRSIRSHEAMLTTNRRHPDAPAEEVSSGEIIAEQTQAIEHNRINSERRQLVESAKRDLKRAEAECEQAAGKLKEVEQEIVALTILRKEQCAKVESLTKLLGNQKENIAQNEKEVAALKDINLAQFGSKLSDLETLNNKVRKNKEISKIESFRNAAAKESESLSRKLDDIDSKKREMIASAKFPVPGMSLGDSGEVLLDGLPFEQASTKGQLMASLAMGAALNPRLRVLLVKSGNDLDKNAMIALSQWAIDNDMQIWIEKIEAGDNPTIVIEDGRAVEPVAKEKELELK